MTTDPAGAAETIPMDVASGVVATASSAGGLQALMILVSSLPKTFPFAIVVVQHIDPKHPSMMAGLLARRAKMNVRETEHGETLRPGTIYIAPPDRHVIVNPNATLSLSAGERVQYVRPSADVLFASVAASFGKKAAAVVLSGTGRDGAAGAVAVHASGGRVIVQDEQTSEFTQMPHATSMTGIADLVLPINQIGPELVRWADEIEGT